MTPWEKLQKMWPIFAICCMAALLLYVSSDQLIKIVQKLPISSEHFGPPKGHAQAKKYAFEQGDEYVLVKPEQHVQIQPFPKSGQSHVLKFGRKSPLHHKKGIYDFPESYVIVLPEARVYSSCGIIITKDDQVIEESCLSFHNTPVEQHWIFKTWMLPSVDQYVEKRIAVIAAHSPYSYFHWMCDVLPKLEVLRLSQIPYSKIFIPKLETAFQKETLEILNIDTGQLIEGDDTTHLKVKELVIPSLPARPTNVPQWVIQFLREKFLPENSVQVNKKIYVPRKHAQLHKLRNDGEISAYLKTQGFEEVDLDTMTVQQQALLFAGSEMIVAPHGDGLTNLVFASPSTKVIEFYHPEWLCECFWEMTQQMNLEHHVVFGKAIPEPPFSHDWVFQLLENPTYDYTVDLEDVKALIEKTVPSTNLH